MEELFDVKHATISEHISNIFKEGELDEKTSVGISDKSSGGRKSKLYNLDVIISVGYRVKSKNGVIFRQWANRILKDYMLKGYAVNQRRLEYLEKTVKLIDIANRIDERLQGDNYRGDNIDLKKSTHNCSNYLMKQIEIVKPKIVLTLGYYPILSLSKIYDFEIGNNLKETIKNYPEIKINDYIVIPLYHPVAQIRKSEQLEQYKRI